LTASSLEKIVSLAIDEMKAGKMDVKFINGEIDAITWYEQQSGTTHPFQETNPETFLLTGFEWRQDEKPSSKDDLLVAIGRKEGSFKLKQNSPLIKSGNKNEDENHDEDHDHEDEDEPPQLLNKKKGKLLKPK